jgi:hypothetical protein
MILVITQFYRNCNLSYTESFTCITDHTASVMSAPGQITHLTWIRFETAWLGHDEPSFRRFDQLELS